MKIVIIYATYSSGTLVVSEIIQSELQKSHTVELINVANVDIASLDTYDVVLMGSPSWMNNNKDGQPHHLYYDFMKNMESVNLGNKNFAVFGLGDNAYARLCGAVDVLEEFVTKIKGKLIIPSLRIDSFYFDQKNNEEKVKEWTHRLNSILA